MSKVVASAAEAVADIGFGSSLAVGGFGLCGVPVELIEALRKSGVSGLSVVSNNCGLDDFGLGTLLATAQIARMTSSYVGENKEFARQFLAGALEVELVPQGTLAERLRAGGSGIPAFYTPTGVGTLVAEGGIPWRYSPDGSVSVASPPREVREFDGHPYVLERSVVTDYALVRAARGDCSGNLVFNQSARNFNPLCAMAGRVTIAEVEELVEVGELDPDAVHLPGVFVQRVVRVEHTIEKRIERQTARPRPEAGVDS
ncbi:MAG: 3-oxoacid CoA-transferase, subunit [Acidimicrobiaceae bacterium]|jgi:3-oxoacid CoA-transferase subunit A|nr:3-oxoacid CoA-transferase, subunit [Acidimicrobiaceae bacterium]